MSIFSHVAVLSACHHSINDDDDVLMMNRDVDFELLEKVTVESTDWR